MLTCFAIAAAMPAAWAVNPAPLPKEIRAARTLFIVNQGIEPGTMDVVYDEISKWSRWILIDDREKADVVVVLSAQRYVYGMYGSATSTGRTTQGIAVPIIQDTRYLIVVDAKSGMDLLTLACRHREINGNSRTGKTLVNLFKDRFPKKQR